jgi:hypothetical protein
LVVLIEAKVDVVTSAVEVLPVELSGEGPAREEPVAPVDSIVVVVEVELSVAEVSGREVTLESS